MSSDKICKRCRNKVTQSMDCMKCGNSYHPSCATRDRVLNSDGRVVCCGESSSNIKNFNIIEYINKDNVSMADLLQVMVNMYQMIRSQNATIERLMDAVQTCDVKSKLDEISADIDRVRVEQTKPTENKPSYSKITARKKDNVIILQPKTKDANATEVRNDIKTSIDPLELKGGIRMGKTTKKGGIILECNNAETMGHLSDKIETKLTDKYTIEKPRKIVPRVKILDIHEESNDDNLLNRLIEQNKLSNKESDFKIVYKSKPVRSKFHIVIECDKKTQENILQRERIYIGWMSCRAQEDLRVLRCFNCQKYGHLAKHCRNNTICPICSGNHKSENCDSAIKKCNNCEEAKKRNLQIDSEHTAWDSKCPYYLRIRSMQESKIDHE